MKKLRKHISSQENAWRGMVDMFATQLNFNIELIAAALVIVAGFSLKISQNEWYVIILCIAGVLAAETINTSIEMACDAITKEYNSYIRASKDMGAAAVLIMALAAFIIGCMIFLPKIAVLL